MKVFMSEYSIHQKAPPEFIPQGGRGACLPKVG